MATTTSTPAVPTVDVPIPVYKLAHRYLLYDANAVTHLRREHNISGVLIGTLPQASQQNVFLGLPLELMPEEARWLVEQKIGYIVDDVAAHKRNFMGNSLNPEERHAYQAALRKQGLAAANDQNKKSNDRKKAALKKLGTENWNDIPDDMLKPVTPRNRRAAQNKDNTSIAAGNGADDDDVLFASPANSFPAKAILSQTSSNGSAASPEPYGVTPTTSYPPLQALGSSSEEDSRLPRVPKSYPLYKHLHEKEYFMAPGLRFGCQYMAYPGDPLRFHSHFLCNGMDWDEEFDLLDLVGGGRLGTGVKKGFLVGGEEPRCEEESGSKEVRTFCIEWGGM